MSPTSLPNMKKTLMFLKTNHFGFIPRPAFQPFPTNPAGKEKERILSQ
jgi:hypothetical protein